MAVDEAARRLGIEGSTVDRVEALGKHLLVRLETGAAIHTHQGMKGSWFLYRLESRRRRPSSKPRARIRTDTAEAICLRAPVVEVLSSRELHHHPALTRLGPDLLSPSLDLWTAREGLQRRPEVEIGVALMDQTAVAGVGNVYKSEVLFLAGISPARLVGDLDDSTLEGIIALGQDLMARNVGAGERRTTPPGSPTALWVYRRARQPCHRCGRLIRRIVQGEQVRSTYFCPGCQGSPPG